MEVVFSSHAARRLKERGIRQEAINVLLCFGEYRPNGRGGATVVGMTATGRAKARADLGPEYDRLMKRLDIVVILVDGVLVTVYHRCRRLRFGSRHRARRGRWPTRVPSVWGEGLTRHRGRRARSRACASQPSNYGRAGSLTWN